MLYSNNWKTWVTLLDLKTCLICREQNGKIYSVTENIYPRPPIHPSCRCQIKKLKALLAGEATNKGENGADWWLKHYGILPDYYITSNEAKKFGWNPKLGNLSTVCQGKMIFGGVYKNINKHLPTNYNRIWYEADINYNNGYRGTERILFSNDGLIFVTYDHYKTFIEIA